MKKYKLKKDFPSSKIGDVWIKVDSGFMSPEDRETIKMHEHLFKPFNDWFEDYEEPKEYWYIEADGSIIQNHKPSYINHLLDGLKSIGNYFETKEEAEQAVEKLKAFKRLQNLGFRFEDIRFRDEHNYIEWKIKAKNELTDDEIEEFRDDLQKVFGGKE